MRYPHIRILSAVVLTSVMGSRAWAQGVYAAQAAPEAASEVVKTEVEYLGDAVGELKDAVASPLMDDNDIHAQAASIFGRIPMAETTRTGPVNLRGWYKPKIYTAAYAKGLDKEDISVQGMSDAVYKTLTERRVPPPSELADAYLHGEHMKSAGLKNYDDRRILGDGQLGVYMYKGAEQVGIYFHKMMRQVQSWAGNEFAAATDVHESAHSRDHSRGELNPVEVRYGETLAYRTEYMWLNAIDPTGEKLSWARTSMGKFAKGPNKAPEFVAEYLEHLAMIRDFGNRDDFYGLVAKLGYKDRRHHPSHPHGRKEPGRSENDHEGQDPHDDDGRDHDGHDHDGDDVENAERPGEEPQSPPPLVRYVNFPG